MTRTEKLLYTLVVLVVSFILFLFFQNFEKINSDINEFITSMKEPKINIPMIKLFIIENIHIKQYMRQITLFLKI